MKQTTIQINNMMCHACEKVVTKRLLSIKGVSQVAVDVKGGRAVVMADVPVRIEDAANALDGTHYQVVSVA